MSATPRDLLKSREQRLYELYHLLYDKAGQANSQAVTFGGDFAVGTTNTRFQISTFTAVIIGQKEFRFAPQDNLVIAGTTAADTAAGQFRKVLVEIDNAGTISTVIGAAVTTVQADAVLPRGSTTKVSLGWIEIPASFTVGTTAVTTGMLKKMPYWAWNDVLTANNGY